MNRSRTTGRFPPICVAKKRLLCWLPLISRTIFLLAFILYSSFWTIFESSPTLCIFADFQNSDSIGEIYANLERNHHNTQHYLNMHTRRTLDCKDYFELVLLRCSHEAIEFLNWFPLDLAFPSLEVDFHLYATHHIQLVKIWIYTATCSRIASKILRLVELEFRTAFKLNGNILCSYLYETHCLRIDQTTACRRCHHTQKENGCIHPIC